MHVAVRYDFINAIKTCSALLKPILRMLTLCFLKHVSCALCGPKD